MVQLHFDPEKVRLLESDSRNLLIIGHPGSGKTTMGLMKAKQLIDLGLKQGQKVLFLSFARTSVLRVKERVAQLIEKDVSDQIEVDTYHGFAWNIIRSHGYLVGNLRPRILLPHDAAVKLAGKSTKEERWDEQYRLFQEEGMLHFDLFSEICTDLLSEASKLTKILCDSYPIIILDEFQDTDEREWRLVRELEKYSRIIALADPDQRIYDFRGADPKRITEYIEVFKPEIFDFGDGNHRSAGTDIIDYGNDLLSSSNIGKSYNDVKVSSYSFYKNRRSHRSLKYSVLDAMRRLGPAKGDWSLAILVSSNSFMMDVSDYLEKEHDKLPSVKHNVAFDKHGPALAGVFIGAVLEGSRAQEDLSTTCIANLCNYLLGRKGDKSPSQADARRVSSLQGYLASGKISGKRLTEIVDDCSRIAKWRMEAVLSGSPESDWLEVMHLLLNAEAECLKEIGNDARYLRLLHKGSHLRSTLNDIWKEHDDYPGASAALANALLYENLELSTTPSSGVHVMTIHKSKGKEYDEVIIYEGLHQGRLLQKDGDTDKARLLLRVAVTRAKQRVTILTPQEKRCPLL